MLAYTYVGPGRFELIEKQKPVLQDRRDAIVRVTMASICTSDLHIKHGWVNNCTDPNGGWALGCRIDGGQAEYVRVPYADQGLTKIPDSVTDQQALFVGDILATGYWAADIAEISEGDTVLIIGAGLTGICTLQCVLLKLPKQVIVCEKDPQRRAFVQAHYPQVLTVGPDEALPFVHATVITAGLMQSWRWQVARKPSNWLGSAPGPMQW